LKGLGNEGSTYRKGIKFLAKRDKSSSSMTRVVRESSEDIEL
jgi:hypothetical protein